VNSTSWWRWLLVVLAGLVVVGVATVAVPARADGLDDLCQTVPAPVRPDYQVSGLVMDKPDLATVPNAAPDPFKDPSVPISDVFGWSWRFTNYDLGCGNDFIRDPHAVATTDAANFVMAWMATLTSWLASLQSMANTGVFDWMQGVVTSVADILRDRVLTVWLPLAAVVLSIVIVFTSGKASYADTMRRVGMLLGSILLAVVTLVLPKQAMGLANDAVNTAAGVAQAGFTSNAADLVTREAIYKTWLVGNFGSADSPLAQEYGPRLMSALTYTWSDVKRMEADPGAKAKIDSNKATEYKAIADEVQKKDPTAYASLTGKTDTRTAPATMGVVWVVLMGLFVAISSFIIVMAKLIMLGLILYGMVAPVIGVLKFSALQRVWDLFTAAVLNVVKFTVAAGLMTLVLSALSTAPVGMGWRMLLAIIATVIALMFTRPIKSFKAMAGMDPNKSAVASMMKRAVGTAVGTLAGNKVWDGTQPATSDENKPAVDTTAPHETMEAPQPVEPSRPPLPPAPPLYAISVAHSRRALDPAPATAWAGYTAVDGRTRAADPELSAGPQPAELPASSARQLRALPAGTVALPAVAVAASKTTTGASRHAPPDIQAVETEERPTLAPEPVLDPGSVQPLIPTPQPAAASQPAGIGAAVVYPTGIITQTDPSLYRRGNTALVDGEHYHRFNEPQVDQNGQQTWEPVYHPDMAST